ncbi:unnamed protein product [Cylicocyclus nassatus]|uniref:Uncharacterized protein n=1 Tax=Cylicocyclus nassatus TaxID=53992 RepID=A0AA36GJN9_CYLNA|nr:unnamed protein product [Cylicocyclus nassatus]
MESTVRDGEEVSVKEKQVLATRTAEECQSEGDTAVLSLLQRRTWQQTRRIVAWILRFVRNVVGQANTNNQSPILLSTLLSVPRNAVGTRLNGKEILIAGKLLIRLHQQQITSKVINSMQRLNIKKDAEGLFRCYGRLGNSNLDDDAKIPLIILQNSMLAERIIDDCHGRGHLSTNALLLICLLSAFCGNANALAKVLAKKTHSIKCIPGGVELLSKETVPYEVCAEDYCKSISAPKTNETIHFPPQVTLYEQFVQWKLLYNETSG